jgi:hypothetical protein
LSFKSFPPIEVQIMAEAVIKNLFRDALAADDAYNAELTRVFKKQACNARYDARGVSTAELRRLRDAKRAADLELHNAFRKSRGEQALAA